MRLFGIFLLALYCISMLSLIEFLRLKRTNIAVSLEHLLVCDRTCRDDCTADCAACLRVHGEACWVSLRDSCVGFAAELLLSSALLGCVQLNVFHY